MTPHPVSQPVRRSLLERRTVFAAAVALMVFLGLAAHFRSFAGPDMGFLLDEAGRSLDGERMYVDLVDMNPPMIVVLNMGAVLVARQLGISEITAYRLGCSTLLLAMLLLSVLVLRYLLPGKPAVRHAVALLLTFVLFVLAGQDFGEREHLLLALLAPYLLLSAARAMGREIPRAPALLIGLLAGTAFALKPHFAILWLAIETYLRLVRRVGRTQLFPETAGIAGFVALYGGAILLWAPGYFQLVRLLAGPYTHFLHVPFWDLLLRGPGALLTLFTLLAFVALRRFAGHPELHDVLALGAFTCLVAGAAQQKGFGYHFYPASALAVILLGTLAVDRAAVSRDWVTRTYRVIALSLMVTVVATECVRAAAATIQPTRDLEQQQAERLVPVVRARAAGQRVYVMSYNISSAYPLMNYAGARSASRFAQLWLLPAMYMDQLQGPGPLRYRSLDEMGPSERYLNQAVFEDLRDQRPKLLLVLQHARDLPANGFRRLDYVRYFSRDPRIAQLLEQYQLVNEETGFLVYERLTDGAVRAGPPPAVQPGVLDVARGPNVGSIPARIRDTGFQLAMLMFMITAVLATLAERGQARVAPGSA